MLKDLFIRIGEVRGFRKKNMEIFDIIGSLMGTKENLRNDTEYTFFNKKVLYASFGKADHISLGIDLAIDFSHKEMIITSLIAKLGFPVESIENSWYLEKSENSDFSESKIEKKSFKTIDIKDINEVIKLDLLRWNYNNYIITLSDYPLVRGLAGNNLYINIK